MITASLLSATELLKNAAAALGAGGVIVGAYVAAGLPLPATQAFVDARIATVVQRIDGLNATTLDLQLQTITAQKARLRFELKATETLVAKADVASRVTLNRRGAEINDELTALDVYAATLRTRIDQLRQPKL